MSISPVSAHPPVPRPNHDWRRV